MVQGTKVRADLLSVLFAFEYILINGGRRDWAQT
jgi:hypothetical protein